MVHLAHFAVAAAAALLMICGHCSAEPSPKARFYFRGAGQAREEDARKALSAELADHGARIQQLEDGLRRLYSSLPKTSDGNLGHQAVRYALHRFFLNRHGWFIRGLEPSQAAWQPESNKSFVKEWVPSFLQELVEKMEGQRGSDLHDVAAMAAALEDLVHKEAQERMTMVYQAHGLDPAGALSRLGADEVLSTYFMSFLVANNFSAVSSAELLSKKSRFRRTYKNYSASEDWFNSLVSARLDGPAFENQDASYDLHTISEVANSIGEEFHSFNDVECDDLRSALQNMESRTPGRVRLSMFYNRSRYSHWRFTEKMDYLRALGALDESDPSRPSVIIPNYVMSRGNCLDGFHLYAICCRNACEDLMGHLELQLGAPTARPEQIAELVAGLGSASVQAPRNLSAYLLGRLEEVARHHGGQVPLHGRLFSQWMHHAYPLECPYPHEQGTINPQTPVEWLRETGQASEQASEEEMHAHIHSDTCALDWEGRPECEGESTELPWTVVEELLIPGVAATPAFVGLHRMLDLGMGENPRSSVLCFSVLSVVAGVNLGLLALILCPWRVRSVCGGSLPEELERQQKEPCVGASHEPWLAKLGGVFFLTFLAYGAGLLDLTLFSVSVAVGLLLLRSRSVVAHMIDSIMTKHKALPGETKCV